RRGDHRVRVRRALAAELHHEAPHARIPGREAVLIDEVLPDRHGVATAAESQFDELAVRRAGTRGRGPVARRRPRRELRKAWRARPGVGGHLTGRFWWRPPAAGRADRDSGGLEIAARRPATNAGRLFGAAERAAQPPQRENLHALRTLVFRSRTAWLRRFQGPGTGCPRRECFGLPRRRRGAHDHQRVHRALQHPVADRAARASDARGRARGRDGGMTLAVRITEAVAY